ncbi:phosphoesterase PA-phosphatase [Micromonospora sp. DH14]|uniref:phosphoesterase PA-phosphatase n=1 Tax=Micromonospora sp. DH14 TaxID=3040120 RepID=UPI00244352BC|nr:phosphoesterase PA-phosphatase [Micromonospora sp. DH14]MDG9674763.1 phosphoesterase PA-phosphatase [Micromonospora sp. DH14]
MNVTIDLPQRPSLADRVARAATEVFAPTHLTGAMPIVIGIQSAATARIGLAWGLTAALFCSVFPRSVVWLGVRRGQLTDRHVGRREQRRAPMVWGLLSVLGGLAILVGFGAPRSLTALVVATFAIGLTLTAVNLVWKISVHAAVAAGSAAVLVSVLGPPLLLLAVPVVALIGWSRIRLRDHTPAQVVAGTGAGLVISMPIFLVLA